MRDRRYRALVASSGTTNLCWIVLTLGNRPDALQRCIKSALEDHEGTSVLVVSNGGGTIDIARSARVRVIELEENLGAPGGRDMALAACNEHLVGFLDDDAELRRGATAQVLDAFRADERLGAVSLRLIDEAGETQRRHLPRIGRRSASESGFVTTVLEGASVMRRAAYIDAGGYFVDLFYAHEAVELCWRLTDRGWSIRYLAEAEVFHPRTPIERHPEGWARTGRNRVWIARRTLPWPIATVHVLLWLAEGARRAPAGTSRRAYLRGWRSGWSAPIERRPIRWATVWRLLRLGRPPIF